MARFVAWTMILCGVFSIGYGLSILWPFAGTPELDEILETHGFPKLVTEGAALSLAGLVLGVLSVIAAKPAHQNGGAG